MATTISITKSEDENNEFEVNYRTDKFGEEIDIIGKLKENIHSKNMEFEESWMDTEEETIYLNNIEEISDEILHYFYNEYL